MLPTRHPATYVQVGLLRIPCRYGERVPYVVVCGGPQARLMDLVVSPNALITNPYLLAPFPRGQRDI